VSSTEELSPADPGHDPRAWVTPEDLNVAPELLGLPLATPRQRGLAMAADLSLLSLLSHLLNFWLLLAGGLGLYLWLRQSQPALFQRLRLRKPAAGAAAEPARPPRRAAWLAVLVFVLLGGQQLLADWREEPEAARTQSAASAAIREAAEDAGDEARAAMEQAAKEVGAREPGAEAASASAPAAASASAALATASAELAEQRAQIRTLRAELKQAQAPKSLQWREEIEVWLDRIGLSYFWGAVYFALLPVLWPGQSPGKWLLGLRVVELTGKALTPMICFKRYGGYAAGMATGFFGFLQILWDPNRQAIQDKTAHTVVIDARSTRRLALPVAELVPVAATAAAAAAALTAGDVAGLGEG